MLEEFLSPPPAGAAVAVTVERHIGRGTWGDEYAAPVEVWAWVDRSSTLVRTIDGEEVTSSAGVFVAPQYGDTLTLRSRVTLPGDEQRTIVTVADRRQGAALGLPVHVEARLA